MRPCGAAPVTWMHVHSRETAVHEYVINSHPTHDAEQSLTEIEEIQRVVVLDACS